MRILTLAVLGMGVVYAGHVYADTLDITPSFAGAPTGWTVDRQAPASFSDIGTFEGQHDVLGITPGTGPTSSPFYNTQGEGIPISGGAGTSVSALLFLPNAWSQPGAAPVRTDMWGELNTSVSNPAEGNNTTYAIIGYTNYGSSNESSNFYTGTGDSLYSGFRYFDDGTGKWVNLPDAALNYGGWNELSIVFTGTEFEYYVNGILAGTDADDDTATGFNRLIMQGYEFYNVGANPTTAPTAYTADWANVPEPESSFLLGVGLVGLGMTRWRKARRRPD